MPCPGNPWRRRPPALQVCGEAQYTDDIRLAPDALVGALVASTRPHARITRLDASAAVALPGVAGFYSARDIPPGGSNKIGPDRKSVV